MDLKYIIWNYQAKGLHFTCIRKTWSYQLMTADFQLNSMLQTFNAPDIINVFLHTSHINCQRVYKCIGAPSRYQTA